MNTQFHELPDGTRLAYEEHGSGQPVLLLHGVLASRRFFERNIAALSQRYHVYALDFRGHGDSADSQGGNTVEQYARDLHHFLTAHELTGVVAVGWSMGNLVIWEYLAQFPASPRIDAQVCISQGPSDLRTAEWDYGFTDSAGLRDLVKASQENYRELCGSVAAILTKVLPSAADLEWMIAEQCKTLPNTAACVLADQTQRDYRPVIPELELPILAVWGTDEKCLPVAAGQWLARTAPHAELVVFEDSGHMPMWEEADRFNTLVAQWIDAQVDRIPRRLGDHQNLWSA
ncbi:alpha/beta fold hydrolase [Streptomyces griseus]|uniref:alpha/beta fold hydrolase n=1 Tax=Streptomyces griseus TaxID=1911 RepID=UPI0036F71757